jgi:perosamine synthetase
VKHAGAPIMTSDVSDEASSIPHPPQWPIYSEESVAEVVALLKSGRSFDYGYGQELELLESTFAEYHGRRYALALNSGTTALLAAYFALGVDDGDEVAVPVFTFFSTVTPLLVLGAIPVLVDVDARTGNVDVDRLVASRTDRTRALVVTHLWGNPCPMDELVRRCHDQGLPLIEDCSHAHGARYRGRPVGSHADIAIFSIGGHKPVSGGHGGMLLTDDPDLYARACLFANFRHRTDLTIRDPRYAALLSTGLGGNFRISPVASVLAMDHMRGLDEMASRRQRNMTALLDAITELPGLRAVPIEPGNTPGGWYDGVVEVGPNAAVGRDRLVAELVARGLKVRAPSTRPLDEYPIFRGEEPRWSPRMSRAVRQTASRNAGDYPNAHRLAERWIRLPVNYLYEHDSTLPARYAEAFADVLDRC